MFYEGGKEFYHKKIPKFCMTTQTALGKEHLWTASMNHQFMPQNIFFKQFVQVNTSLLLLFSIILTFQS